MKEVIHLRIDDKTEKIILRHIKKKDVEGVWENFNEVVKEGVYLPVFIPVRSQYEMNAWYDTIKQEEEICIVAEWPKLKPSNTIIGQCEVSNVEWEASKHVGNLGIIVKKGFRNIGLGYHLVDFAIRETKRKMNKEKIILSCFDTNKRALHLYEKMGFQKIGVREKQFLMDSEYHNEIMMEIWIDDYLK